MNLHQWLNLFVIYPFFIAAIYLFWERIDATQPKQSGRNHVKKP